MPLRALIILHPGFEEIEAVTPIDLLSRADIEVVQAALGDDLLVPGRSGITLQATHLLKDVAEERFDAIILPGGPGIFKIRKHPEICRLLQKQHVAGKQIACICAAPLLLLDAGILTDAASYTAHPSTIDELPRRKADTPVVSSDNILTSPGAGSATQFSLQLITQLTNTATAKAIAESI